jgi:hypothetical protein
MKINATTALSELKRLLFLALLLVSAAVVVVPQYRVPTTITLHRALLTVACFWSTYRAWKLGQLSKTHKELVDGLANGSIPANFSSFERLSLAAGFLAALVLLFS